VVAKRNEELRVDVGEEIEEPCKGGSSPLGLSPPLAAGRQTIQAEVLHYSVDEEVSRQFNIQRFDEEIQRLSNFSSPLEGWLNDLEQRICARSGTETSLMTLVRNSVTNLGALDTRSKSTPNQGTKPSSLKPSDSAKSSRSSTDAR
jgi:hypothetical protein